MATTLYDASTIINGIAGQRNLQTAGRIYMGAVNVCCLRLDITGTEAKLTISRNPATYADGMLEVSVDGGAYAAATRVGQVFTLFTGLTDTAHTVLVRPQAAYGFSIYLPTTGNVLEVTGAAPAVAPVPNSWYYNGASTSNHKFAGTRSAASAGVSPSWLFPGAGYVGSLYLKGDLGKLWIYSSSTKIFVSEDDVITEYSSPFARNISYIREVTCTAGTHEYLVWFSETTGSLSAFAFGVGTMNAPDALPTNTRRVYQFGDSITQGSNGGTSAPGVVDIFSVGAYYRMASGTFGVAGNTIAQLLARIDADIASAEISTDDVAVLAIGRNNVPTFDATAQANYITILDKLVAAGFSKIICRSVLNGTTYAAFNAVMQSIVSAYNNPKVVYVSMESQTGINYIDGVHPSAAGYQTMAAFEKTAYLPHFGVWNAVSGGTSKTLSIPNAQTADALSYRCVATDAAAVSATSNSATLTVS